MDHRPKCKIKTRKLEDNVGEYLDDLRYSSDFKKIFFYLYLFIYIFYFWLRQVFIAACRLSLVVVSGGYFSLWCTGFSLQWFLLLGAQALGMQASVVVAWEISSCGSQALECGLSSCGTQAQLFRGMWDLPRPGLEPVSPALAGGFLTTASPGMPSSRTFIILDVRFKNMLYFE